MNLHGLVRSAINTVNPDQLITLKRSNGYITDKAGKQIPQYETLKGMAQIQAMSSSDLRHTDNLNIQGTMRAVYLQGNWCGVVRADQKGGDILEFGQTPNSPVQTWKVVSVVETWPDWSKVIVCLQV